MENSGTLWARATANPSDGGLRDALAVAFWRPGYFHHRRRGHDSTRSMALTKAAFETAPPGDRLRESLWTALRNDEPGFEPASPLIGDDATAEADLAFFPEEAGAAFDAGWTVEIVRRAIGLFYEGSDREGQRSVYETLQRRMKWGAVPPAEGNRAERRARRRFREVLRAVVADTLTDPGATDEEIQSLVQKLPTGSESCPRCGTTQPPDACEHLYQGMCPRCLLQIAIDPALPLEQIGPYQIVARLGGDKLGELFRAHQEGDAKDVLLRVLHEPKDQARAREAMRLRHPAVVAIYDAGIADGRAYMVTEFVDGPSLEDALESGPLPAEKVREIQLALVELVGQAHRLGLVHGALDAEGVILDHDGRARVADFGFADDTPDNRAADEAAVQELTVRLQGGGAARTGPATSRRRAPTKSRPVPEEAAAKIISERTIDPARPARGSLGKVPEPGAARTVGLLTAIVAASLVAIAGLVFGARWLTAKPATTPGVAPPTAYERALILLAEARGKIAGRADLPGAIRLAEDVAGRYPQDIHGHCLLARAEYARLKFDAAEAHARQALAIDRTASPAWRIVGFVALERREPEAARTPLRNAAQPYTGWKVARHPEDETDENLARALLAYVEGDSEKALEVLGRIDTTSPTPEARRWSGVITGEPTADIRWQTMALELRKDYTPAQFERGRARRFTRALDAAIMDFDLVLDVWPAHGEALMLRGECYEERGDIKLALRDYEAALALEPRLSGAWLRLGIARGAEGRLDEAEKHLTRSVELAPNEVRGWLERGEVRARRGNWTGALEDAEAAVARQPRLAKAKFNRGVARWKLGRKAEAELDFFDATRLDPRLKSEVDRIKRGE